MAFDTFNDLFLVVYCQPNGGESGNGIHFLELLLSAVIIGSFLHPAKDSRMQKKKPY